VLLVAVIVTIAIAATAWWVLRQDGPHDERAAAPLDSLLLPSPAPGVPGDPPLWTPEPAVDAGAGSLSRRWSARGRAPELAQTVTEHSSAADARRSLRRDNPAGRIAAEFGGKPSKAASRLALDAPEWEITCAASDRDGCKIWVYWARYGQYVVALDYTSVGSAVPLERFEAHVEAVDDRLSP
jgi:hypothetical protein